jgi:branched-chain amino acid transport system permease protein
MDQFLAVNGYLIVSMVLAALLALSLYLPLMAGQLSLASPGFYALGGYIAAILSTGHYFQWSGTLYPVPLVLLEMAIAGLASAGLAVLVGVPALRLRGIYLALATIAFVQIVQVLAVTLDITGGAVGLYGVPQPFDDPSKFAYMWIAGPLLILAMLFVYRLERVRVGRAFIAIREDELAAGAMGINPTTHKVLAFTLGGSLAGMVGALSAHLINTWNPRQGTFDFSISLLAFVLIGGSRTYLGPALGGMILTALPEVLRQLAGAGTLPAWLGDFMVNGRLILFGILLVLGTVFLPQGLITPALFERGSRRVTREKPPQ